MNHSIPQGVTPPLPGQEKEEPDLWQEDDIPSQDEEGPAAAERSGDRPDPGP